MIPRKIVKQISEESGYPDTYISDLLSGRKKAGRKRAPVLGEACRNIGINAPKELWVFGTLEEIKKSLLDYSKNLDENIQKHPAA